MKPWIDLFVRSAKEEKKEKRRSNTVHGESAAKVEIRSKGSNTDTHGAPVEALPIKSSKPASVQDMSSEYIHSQDFSRQQFSYQTLVQIGWWPDEMVIYLDVLRFAYMDFSNHYISHASMFDQALRKAIYFMFLSKYARVNEIKRYVKAGNFEIGENYFSKVTCEDNCYMHEVEEHTRSSTNDNKHFHLAKALEKLLSLAPIAEGDQVLDPASEQLVRIYVAVFNLRKYYAMTDIKLRGYLWHVITKEQYQGDTIYEYFNSALDEIDKETLHYIHKHHDATIFGKIWSFKDLLLFGKLSTDNFRHIFSFTRDIINYSQESSKIYTKSLLTHDEEILRRVEYNYHYYLDQVAKKQKRIKAISSIDDFDVLATQIKGDSQVLLTPRYCRSYDTIKISRSEAVFVVGEEESLTPPTGKRSLLDRKRIPKMRKISMDMGEKIPYSAREDVGSLSETAKDDTPQDQ